MEREETTLLHGNINTGLSIFFATLCVVDIFGVFPIIALPRSIVQCGLFGIPLVLVVFGLQIYTAILLGKSWTIATTLDPQISRKNRYPLAAVTELTLGPATRNVVTVLLDLTVFGAGIPNLLVASQNLQLFGQKVSSQEFDLSFCYWLLFVGLMLCPLMWLGSPRDMKWLATCSCVSVTFTALLIWWCIITDDRELDVMPVPTSPTWDKFISGYGMLAFQFDVHPTVMTVQVDMRQPKSINKAIILAFLVTGSLFGVTTGLAVWKYGNSTPANILEIVPAGFVIDMAILLSALQLCFSSVIGHSALFQHLEDQLHIQRSFCWKRCAMRSAVVCLGVAIGESVPRFDIVMSLIGGTLTGPLVFILPPLIYARVRALRMNSQLRIAPDVYSGTEKESEIPMTSSNPRVHSESVYYGLSKINPSRYSYVYSDDSLNEAETESDKSDERNLPLLDSNQPVMIEATSQIKRRRKIISLPEEPKFSIIKDIIIHTKFFGYCIIVIGILITFSSTYINVRNTVRYVKFTPPCILNANVSV